MAFSLLELPAVDIYAVAHPEFVVLNNNLLVLLHGVPLARRLNTVAVPGQQWFDLWRA